MNTQMLYLLINRFTVTPILFNILRRLAFALASTLLYAVPEFDAETILNRDSQNLENLEYSMFVASCAFVQRSSSVLYRDKDDWGDRLFHRKFY